MLSMMKCCINNIFNDYIIVNKSYMKKSNKRIKKSIFVVIKRKGINYILYM